MIQYETSGILIWSQSELFVDMHRFRARSQHGSGKERGALYRTINRVR